VVIRTDSYSVTRTTLRKLFGVVGVSSFLIAASLSGASAADTHVKVGKKSPMTLAHFGFGKNGEVLDDADLPAVLTRHGQKTRTARVNSPATPACSPHVVPPLEKAATPGPWTSPPAASRPAKT
jgi:hypothetical protein